MPRNFTGRSGECVCQVGVSEKLLVAINIFNSDHPTQIKFCQKFSVVIGVTTIVNFPL